ncbi:methionine--tRNA ligase [Nitrospira sp. Nam80]
MSLSDTFYITTPIYYVNDVPHIGHAYTTVAADVLARYWRLKGRDVFFLTGLDEHGQKVQQAAAKAGIDPQVHCDRLAPQFRQLWTNLNISNDAFIRTTDPHHKSVVQRYLQQLFDQALIYKADYTGWYCTFDERFWTEKDVIDGLCPDCKRPVERLSEHNYFFKMGQYQERLVRHILDHPDFIRPETRRNEVLGFLQTQTLGDLSISRPKSRLSWGIALPFDRDYVTYVWFDALVNYLSALEYLRPESMVTRFWPADVHLVGKDILTTHAVYWSAMLMALNLPLPKTIFAHGWWTVDREKMSKSRGNVVDPHAMIDQYGADAFRYFLLREVPFGQDGDFSESAMTLRINSELADGLGNLLSRSLTMIERFAGSTVPSHINHADGEIEKQLMQSTGALEAEADDHIEHLRFSRALESIWSVIQVSDQYIDKTAPWTLAKKPEHRERLENSLFHIANTLGSLIQFVYPFMPKTAENLAQQLGLEPRYDGTLFRYKDPALLPGRTVKKSAALFPRIDTKHLQGAKTVTDPTPPSPQPVASAPTGASSQPAATPPAAGAAQTSQPVNQITIEDFMKIQLKTAKVVIAERVPKSDKLIKLIVNLGSEQRQIVAGIGKKYEPADLVGKSIVIVANLKPAKLMGIESQGMVLAAGDKDVGGLVTILEEVEPGTKVK